MLENFYDGSKEFHYFMNPHHKYHHKYDHCYYDTHHHHNPHKYLNDDTDCEEYCNIPTTNMHTKECF